MKEYMSNAMDYFSRKMDTYKAKFSESDLMKKIASVGKKVGVTTVYNVLLLYYGLMSGSIPLSKRVMVIAALGYFIAPFDLIPDFIMAGLLDDATVLMFALQSVLPYISEEDKAKAKSKLCDWFGEQDVMSVDAAQLSIFQNKDEDTSKMGGEKSAATDPDDSCHELSDINDKESEEAETNYWDNLNDGIDMASNYLENKEYENALPILLSTYEIFTLPGDYYSLIEELGKEDYDKILEWLCYNIGFCYNEQKDYVRALYYLHQVRFSDDPNCFIEWLNAIVNSSHPSALEIVENIMNDQEDLRELWNEEDYQIVMAFLERRLGYLYTEYGRYEDAREHFTRLLSDPRCVNFARKELDYLDSIENN